MRSKEKRNTLMVPEPYHVHKMRRETRDTFTIELRNENGGMEFHPGQFNMLYVFGTGEVPISISGNPSRPNSLIHTIRAVGDVTGKMELLRKEEMLGIRGPFGTSWPVEEAEGMDAVIIAGGIGLAPLRPVIYHIVENRDKYGKVVILYGTRTPEDILFRNELEKWRGHLDLEVLITVDKGSREWHGNVGVVTTLIKKATFDPFHTRAFICGPEIMMRYSVMELQKEGLPPESIHVSLERRMKCGIRLCGMCQYGPLFICKDGPVFRFSSINKYFGIREI